MMFLVFFLIFVTSLDSIEKLHTIIGTSMSLKEEFKLWLIKREIKKCILNGYKLYVLACLFQSRYALVIKEAFTCMQNAKLNIVMYKNSSSSAKNNVGYVEFQEAIEPNNNFQVRIEAHHRGISDSAKIPSLNVQRTDLCNFISTDLLIVPLIRKIFDLEKFCPLAKGKHIVYKDTIVSKYRPYIPLGCWLLISRITKKESMYTCLNITLQSLPSMKSEPYQCT